MRGLSAPELDKVMNKARVTIPGKVESIWEPLYDFQTCAAAATSSQSFFTTPIGGSKTRADTNLTLAAQISKDQLFVVTAICLDFIPGVEVASSTLDNEYINDVLAFYRNGNINFVIGDKPYGRQGPLMKFPPSNRLAGFAATGTGNASDETISYAQAAGQKYETRDMIIEGGQQFSFAIENRLALPSTIAGRVGVTLEGWLFRPAQ